MGGMIDFARRDLALAAGLAATYAVLAYLGALVAVAPGNITAVFPPSGLALAALLWRGRRLWPGVFVGAVVGNYVSMEVLPQTASHALAASACIGVGSTLQALAGHAVLTRWADGPRFLRSPRGLALFGTTEPLVCLISPTIGVAALAVAGLLPEGHTWDTWLTFWLGDVGGVFLMVPLLLAPASRRPAPPVWELAGMVICVVSISQLMFDRPFPIGWRFDGPLLFTYLPVAVWAGYRAGPRGAAWITFLCYGLSLWGTMVGNGPVARLGDAGLPVLDLFLGGLGLPALILAAAAEQRHEAQTTLLDHQRDLEHRVTERTQELEQANRALHAQIAEKERAEQDLARTRAWLDVAFENVPFEVLICDRDGSSLYQNTVSARRWGDLVGGAPRQRSPDAERDWKRKTARALEGEIVSELVEDRTGGQSRVVEELLAPVMHEDRVEGLVAMSFDVTERHRLFEEVSRTQRMETVARLAGGVAHDFNNLLTAIMGHVSLLGMDPNLRPSTREALGTIELAARRAAELTAQLLTLAGRRAGRPEAVSAASVLDHVHRLSLPILGEGIDSRLDVPEDLWPVRMDPGALDQVLMNMVVNARDAIDGPGQLHLAAANVAAGTSPLHVDSIRIDVADTGAGMPANVMDKVFEPFFTTKGPTKGTGLGLAVCYGLVQRGGGLIDVDSEVGRGTRFSIWLPRNERSGPEPLRTSTPPARAERGTRGGTILLAEDDDAVRALMVTVLREAGYEVLAASNGEEALDVGIQHLDELDLVITDMVMPALGGRGLVERLRTKRSDLPALLTSGYTEELFELGTSSALEAFLSKPYSPRELLRCVDETLAEASKLTSAAHG